MIRYRNPIQDFIHLILEENRALKDEVRELRLRLAKNSSNSNNPPSTDRFERKSKPKSSREKSGKKAGGQPGHQGKTLKRTDNPDEIQYYDVARCNVCNHDLSEVESTDYLARQEIDIPPMKPKVTEHRMVYKHCLKCKQKNVAQGPKELTNSVQYGQRIQSFAVYLHFSQLIPMNRCQELFADIFSLPISQGTLANMHEQLFKHLEIPEKQIHTSLLQSNSLCFDETSLYVNNKTHWLHVASNQKTTAYLIHEKRGTVAMDAMNILPLYKGAIVHDYWKPYFRYDDVQHALCNAHHLRELRAMHEDYGQSWAQEMALLLSDINQTVIEHKNANKQELTLACLAMFETMYDTIIASVESQIPEIAKQPGKRGKAKQHPAKNLLDRLTSKKTETLRCMHDFNVPITNNQAERDVRMVKVKPKLRASLGNR